MLNNMNNKVRIIFIAFIWLLSRPIFAQKEIKVDSTFMHYFKVLDLELKGDKNLRENIRLYDEIILNNGEKVYVNKYVNQAISFLQNISKINAPKKYVGQSMAYYVDEEIINRWKEWYTVNRSIISWCIKKKEPYIPFWRKVFN